MSHNENIYMRTLWLLALLVCSVAFLASPLTADEGTRLTVQITAATTGKPIDRASVIIHFKHGLNPVKMRKNRTSWETKTNQDGSVTVPAIPMGEVTIQVIAQHYQTFGDTYQLNQPDQTVAIKLNPPQHQYSEHRDGAK